MFWKFVGVFVVLLMPVFVLAHATPVTYTPLASGTERTTPASISIHFTERIEVGASSLTVYGPSGEKINEGKGELDSQDARRLSVPIKDKGEGVYTVSWQVVSVDDGHFTKGGYSFLVNRGGEVYDGGEESVEVTYSTNLLDVTASFLNLVGESLFVALFALSLLFFAVKKERFLRSEVLPHVVWIGFLLFASGTLFGVIRKSVELAGLQEVSIPSAMLLYVMSSVGAFAVLKLLGAVVCALFFIHFNSKPTFGKILGVGVILSGVVYMQAFISHASASLFFPEFSVALTFVHLFSKEFLVGGVLLLCVLFFTEKKRLDYKHKAVLFDAVASLMLLGAGITGTYVTWLHLKSWDNLFITEWGILFISLLLATLFLGTFRILHQFIIHPFLHTKLARVYGMTLPVEALLGLCVLFFSAYISMTTPPFTVSAYTYEAEADDFILDVHPYEESMFRIRLADVNGLEKLTAVAENTQLGIGPNVLPLQKRSNDSYVFPRSDLSPNGEWEIRFILQQSGAYDAVSSFHLKYPDDVEVTHYSHESRSFDSFALQLSIFATGFLLLCIVLLVHGYVHYTKQRNEAMYAFPYAPAYLAGSFAITALLCGVYFALLFHIPGATFERMCEKAGYEWVQTYPTRDFARTSQNTYLGCKVHDGHYHFIDEAEYQELFPSEE